MSLFSEKKKQRVIAVFDMASASVGGMLIKQDKEGKPEIISSRRVPVNFLLDVDFDAFWRCARGALKKILEQLLKDFPKGPDAALCVFFSPWFISQTKIIGIEKEKPFKITKDFFEKLMRNEEEFFKKKWSSKLEPLRGEPEFIEHEILKTELNGYHTNSPINKTAKKIKAYIHMSLGIKEVKDEIEKEVLKNFGDIFLQFKTFPMVAFKILNGIINTSDGLILIDIGGEITELSLIRNDNLEETVSFSRGRNFLLRKIASEFNAFPDEAESMLQTYLNGHADESNSQKLFLIIEKAKKEWRDFFYKALKIIFENKPLPQNVFLAGDDPVSKEFIKCAEEDFSAEFTILGKPFIVNKIMPEGIAHYFNLPVPPLAGQAGKDIFLMMESIFANKIL